MRVFRCRACVVLLVLLTAGGYTAWALQKARDPKAAINRAAAEMAQAAQSLWNSLTPEQQAKAGFTFKDDERLNWHFIPKARKGLPLKEMTPAQRHLAQAFLSSGLSQRGYAKAITIMSLEQILNDLEKGGGPTRDPELYFFSIFGTPGGKEPWGWRVEGHHLAMNFTIVAGKGIAGGPSFHGTNPARVLDGPRKGLRVLEKEEDLARQLVKSLSEEQRKTAVLSAEAPKDIITGADRKAKSLQPAGIAATQLSPAQREMLMLIVEEYANRLRPEIAESDLGRIVEAGTDKISFGWAGSIEENKAHYYRVQGPTFLIEYDNIQNNANHVHAVWRDLENDFGDDMLRRHYEEEKH